MILWVISVMRATAPSAPCGEATAAATAGERWYEVVGDPTLADAILDRIIHNAYRIELKGESMRKLKAANTEPDARKPVKEAPQNVTASASTPAKLRRK